LRPLQPSLAEFARERVPVGYAIRRALKKGYGRADLRADVLAGTVVAIVALPLSMALAIAVGAPPQHGLYTAIFAGFVTALLGGCKFQVTGPTAAFVVILAPIVNKYGLSGLLTAGFMAGLMLVAMGVFKLGNFIKFIPYTVTTGFTTGIATVIATLQVKDAFGITVVAMPDHYLERIVALWHARGTSNWREMIVASATLALLLGIPKLTKKIPAPLVAMAGVAGVVAIVHHFLPSFFTVATIGTRFHGIPHAMPTNVRSSLMFHATRSSSAASEAIGTYETSGARSSIAASTRIECVTAAIGERAPARMFVAVRASAPVAAMPPKNGAMMLPMPSPTSSAFGS